METEAVYFGFRSKVFSCSANFCDKVRDARCTVLGRPMPAYSPTYNLN